MSNNQTQANPFEKEPDFDEEHESREKLALKIQKKIIAYFELGQTDLSQDSDVEVDEAIKSEFLRKVASGEIGDQQFQDLIKELLGLDQSENKGSIDLYDEQIIALKSEASDKYPALDLQKAQKETENVATGLRSADGASMLNEQKLGWDNASLMIAQDTANAYNSRVAEGAGKAEMIYPSRSKEIADQVQPDENSKFNPDKDLLIEAGLTPKYRLQIGPRIINFSFGCELGNGYTAVMGYIETDDKVIAQTFYKDDEHGTWRYANEDIESPDARGLFVPIEIQDFLDQITANGHPKINVKNAKQIFPEVLVRNVP